EHGLGVVSYFSLASGFLTGKYRTVDDLEGRPRAGFLRGYFEARGRKVLEALLAASADVSAPPSQVALAWLLARPAITAPIASATSVDQLDEILGAVALTLPAPVLARLDAAGA